MTTRTKQRYRPPSIEPEVKPVRLDDFDRDDILEYLRHCGKEVSTDCANTGDGDGLFIAQCDLDRAETLAICGQIQHARDYILDMVSRRIGRRL